jgi:hypothetical protein
MSHHTIGFFASSRCFTSWGWATPPATPAPASRAPRCAQQTSRGVAAVAPSPQDVGLRGVVPALIRIQAYMAADIVVAISAVDLAIEAVM